MHKSRQIALLERLVGVDVSEPWSYAPASLRNPASAYTCPQRFAEEMRVLFRERPQFAGLSGECANPGAYMTATLGGVPLVIMRQEDGSLRAFVNACRHRGATLLEGSGAGGKRLIVCPYHGWTYDTAGTLMRRPASGHGFDDVATECNLHTRAVAEKHGLIFVHPTSNEPFEVDPLLHGAADEFAEYGLKDYVHIETRVNEWRVNWKLLLDTFTESYHIRWLHKDTIAPLFLNDTLFDAFGPHSRTIGLRKTVVEQLANKPKAEWELLPYGTTQYILVPNGLIVYQLDHIEMWRVTPHRRRQRARRDEHLRARAAQGRAHGKALAQEPRPPAQGDRDRGLPGHAKNTTQPRVRRATRSRLRPHRAGVGPHAPIDQRHSGGGRGGEAHAMTRLFAAH